MLPVNPVTVVPLASTIFAVNIRELPDARLLVLGLANCTAVAGPGPLATTVKLTVAAVSVPLAAWIVTFPAKAPVTDTWAWPLLTVTVCGKPVTVPGPAAALNVMLPVNPVTVVPLASTIFAVNIRELPDARLLVLGLTNCTAVAGPGPLATTVKETVAALRVPLAAWMVTLPAEDPNTFTCACPLVTVTVCGKPVTVPGPAVALNVMLPVYPVTVFPPSSTIFAVNVRGLPDVKLLVFGLTNCTAKAGPGPLPTTAKVTVEGERVPLAACKVTLPGDPPVTVTWASPLLTATVCGKPVTVPGPAVVVNVILPEKPVMIFPLESRIAAMNVRELPEVRLLVFGLTNCTAEADGGGGGALTDPENEVAIE
jgi:hypothetical protein